MHEDYGSALWSIEKGLHDSQKNAGAEEARTSLRL
jgi:hypothetical protein